MPEGSPPRRTPNLTGHRFVDPKGRLPLTLLLRPKAREFAIEGRPAFMAASGAARPKPHPAVLRDTWSTGWRAGPRPRPGQHGPRQLFRACFRLVPRIRWGPLAP